MIVVIVQLVNSAQTFFYLYTRRKNERVERTTAKTNNYNNNYSQQWQQLALWLIRLSLNVLTMDVFRAVAMAMVSLVLSANAACMLMMLITYESAGWYRILYLHTHYTLHNTFTSISVLGTQYEKKVPP